MTPKRNLNENFSRLEDKIQAAAYSQLVNKFYFFNDRGWMLIYRLLYSKISQFSYRNRQFLNWFLFFICNGKFSGNGGDDDRVKLTYRQTGLRMVPNAMFVANDRLFAICRNQIWVASVSAPRLYFSFYTKLKSQDRIRDFLPSQLVWISLRRSLSKLLDLGLQSKS